ncbi:MAG: leucine-rich repeat protein, partial [Christensenellales bacterium]
MSSLTVSLALFLSEKSDTQINSFGAVVLCDNSSYKFKSKIKNQLVGDGYLFNDVKMTVASSTNPVFLRAHVYFESTNEVAKDKIKFNSFSVEDHENYTWSRFGDYWYLCDKSGKFMSINSTKAGEVYVFLNQLDAIVPEMQGVLGEDEFVSCEIVVQSSLASNFSNTTDFSEINKSFDKNATETTKSGTYSVVFKQNGATLSTQTINYGGKATIPEMTIAEGEVFLCWNTREDGSGANITNEQLGYITQNLTLFPIFENQKVLVTVVQSEGGTITPETQMVDWGSDLLLHFTPSKNYVLKRILINGDPVGATSEYLLKRITGSVEVSAEFVSDFIILDINGGNGTQPNVVYNADQTKFKIEEGSEPTKSGKEFYYYSTNSADNEQGQNGVRYDIGRWYDVPNTSGSSTLYAIYLTPTNNYTTAQNYIVVPKSVTTIADCTTNMFSATNSTVKFVTFPLQTKSLGKKILANCSALKGVSMSDYVSTIGEGAFLGDNSLEKIVIPQDLNGIGKQAFKNCSLLSQVTGLQSCLLTQISDSCFENCSKLTEVVLPSTIVLIGSGAFNSSGIAKINLKDTKITQIGASAFKSCSSLSSVYLPSTVQSIGQEAFSLSGLTELKNFAGTSVEVISSQTFLGTPLVGIELPQTLTRIDNQAFGECSELKIVGGLANTVVTMIDSSAFAGCEKLVGMIFPQTLLTLGDSAFEGCLGLVNVVFDSSLIQIGERCFNGCENLSTLGNFVDTQVESIGDAAFKDCASLSDVSLPSTIQSIGDRSFENCSALATITFINGDNLSTLNVASNTFNGTTSTLKVNILDEAHFDAYITKLNGKGFAENAFMFFLGNIDRKAFYKNGVWEKFRDAVITSIAGDHGTISPSGAVVYSLGSSANYVISPETGYKIKSILIDGVEIAITAADGNSQSYQFDDIQKDHTISATFEQRMFKISVVCGENGTIDPNFSEDYAYGSNVTYIITPNNGYVIKDVFIDGLSNAKAREDSKYTFSNIHAPHEIEVVFEVVTYTIVCSVGEGGSMSPNASLVTKNWGESYAITFTPNTNYVISNVIIDGDALNLSGVDLSKAYKYTFTNIRANHVISCLFETTIRTLTFDPNGGQFSDGSTNMMKTLSYDSIIGTLPTATREGYIFRGWNTRIDTTETIDYSTKKYSDVFGKEDGWLYAIYEVKTFTISTSSNGHGAITGSVVVDWGSTTTIEMTPDKGYRVASYSIDGGAAINSTVQAGKSDYYTFSNITANHSIVATFVPITYQVKYNGNGATSGSMSNSTHTYDEEKQLTANSYSKTGYSFAGWTKSADGAGTIYANKEKVKNLSETQGSVVDLYAKWTANTYTATFNANGGTVSPTTKSVTYNSAYGSLPTPTRAGYTFVCWTNSLFNMADYLVKWNGSTNQGTASVNRPNNEFTLTATGSDCYTNPWNGASYRIQVSPSTTYLFSWKQDTQTSSVNNFVFLYDSSTASSYTTAYSNESYDSATGRYYISFTTASTTNYVGFRFGIGSASGTSLTFSEVKLEEKPSISDFALGAYATESTTIVNMPKDHTLYAQWTANTYTITWNAIDASLIANLWNYAGSTGYTSSNSGSNSAYSEKTAKTPKSNVIYDGTISYFSPIPNRLGYTFNGWFTASS